MRSLTKQPCPAILEENGANWLAEYLADKTNSTKRYRYRHRDIKATLKVETQSKCIYCESKIGHNTPGDIEHKIPSSKDETQHFSWDNLTIACTECNRRKNDFYEENDGFLDPYVDDVEGMLRHVGPIVLWHIGNHRAETTLKILELHNEARNDLIAMKIRAINTFTNLLERVHSASDPALRLVLCRAVADCISRKGEFSAMLKAVLLESGLEGIADENANAETV